MQLGDTAAITTLFVIIFLVLAFAPVFTGHYLINREFYGYLTSESSFWAQINSPPAEADPGGRFIGVVITQAVSWLITSIKAAACIRFLLVLTAAGFCLILASDLRRQAGLPRIVAASIAVAAMTLPAVQVTVSNITQAHNLLALFPAYLAGRLAIGAGQFKVIEWLAIVILMLIALTSSPVASMAFCLPPLIWVWSREDLPIRSLIRQSFYTGLCFAAGAVLYILLTKTGGQHSSFSVGITSSTLKYAGALLTIAASLWDTSSARPAEFFLAAIIIGGATTRIIRFRRRGMGGVAVVSIMLALAWASAVCLPRIAISNYPVMAYRHTLVLSIALMVLAGMALWELLRRMPPSVTVAVYCLLALSGAVICQRTLTTHLVTPTEAELNFAKARLRSADPDTLRHIHVVFADSKRQTLPGYYEEYSGLQSTLGAPSDGQYAWMVVLTALNDLMKEDPRFIKALPYWDWRQANTRVTASDSTTWHSDLARQTLPMSSSLVIDFSPLTVLGNPDYTAADQHTEVAEATVSMAPTVGRPISSGDYPGFPAANAFNGDYWVSRWASQTDGSEAYLGVDFGSSTAVTKIVLRQGGVMASRARLQSSADCTIWQDRLTLKLVADANYRSYPVNLDTSARCWRFLISKAPGNVWTVYELKFAE
ncbi:MAG: discoidin domain-containing protein [Methylobacter sp.]|nr:discoidin domain-containing protein [Methylobacter sp.]